MNKGLTVFVVIAFGLILTFLLAVVELQVIEDNILAWSIGSIVLANVIGVISGKTKNRGVSSPVDR